MEEYCFLKKDISREENDVITSEEFPSDAKTHPRAIMLVRRTNDRPYPFFTQSVIDIITKGDGCDPITRQPFSELTKQRAELYVKSLEQFPEYRIDTLDSRNLYTRWIDTYKDGTDITVQVRKIRLEANCFLQAKDLIGVFMSFGGKGSLENRESAISFLNQTGRKWILRNCSLQDTEFSNAYALTYLIAGIASHVLIVHRIGDGFYYDVRVGRGTVLTDNFEYSRCYPTIVSLLDAEISGLLKLTANSS